MAPEPSGGDPGGRVVVVGGGLAGVACARRLHDAGRPVTVLERSHRLGGRMAVRTEQLPSGPHPVDIGAPYFTVRDERFQVLVEGWKQAGRAATWTDTFYLATPQGRIGTTTDPQRWSSPRGMRSLVEDLANGLDVRLRHEVQAVTVDGDGTVRVDGDPVAAVAVATPDPQADRILPPGLAARLEVTGRAWAPELVVWAAWPERWWPPFDGIFVDGSDVLAMVADDGRSRGDDAPVLVAHTTNDYAERMLDDAPGAIDPVLAELPRVIGTGHAPPPSWARVHRWSMASSRHPHTASYALVAASEVPGAGLVGVCGDGWGQRSRVEQAWASGDALASALLGP